MIVNTDRLQPFRAAAPPPADGAPDGRQGAAPAAVPAGDAADQPLPGEADGDGGAPGAPLDAARQDNDDDMEDAPPGLGGDAPEDDAGRRDARQRREELGVLAELLDDSDSDAGGGAAAAPLRRQRRHDPRGVSSIDGWAMRGSGPVYRVKYHDGSFAWLPDDEIGLPAMVQRFERQRLRVLRDTW